MTEEPRQPGNGDWAPPPPPGGQPGYGQPSGYEQPGYQQPGHGQQSSLDGVAYAPPAYGQPLSGEPGIGQPGIGQPGIGQPVAGQPASGVAGLQNVDLRSVDPLDWGIIAAGLVAFVFSTFNYFTYKVAIGTFSKTFSVSAWHGALAPIATLLASFAALLLAAQVIAKVQLAFPVRLVVLGAFALASLLLLVALFVTPGNTGNFDVVGISIDKGHGVGYWVSLLAVLAGTALSWKRFTDTGGTLPARG